MGPSIQRGGISPQLERKSKKEVSPSKVEQNKATDLAVWKEDLEPVGPLQILVTLSAPELLQTPVYKETKKTKSQQQNEKITKRA